MLTTVENVLNRGLPRSPRARQLCGELAGRSLGVEVRGVTRIVVRSNGDVLHCTRDAAGAAEAEVSGSPLSLLALAGPSAEEVLHKGAVEIRGDADIARKYRELARLLLPDLEEELSLAIGDVPAHQLGRLARAVFDWSRQTAATAARNVAEYLAHERADLVPRAEAEQFTNGVDRLREDVDRLEARINQLAP
ncbi:MAG TPA: SCP2 sterol-binding domain-containing protein [Steroidobacteraceae bacterium]|jgi:ubiquinone biosynthesis protein UbiJ|nr:SCP2 sterol-binding domain-containing protein [Steroidobacteraceae bacterium]